MAVSSSQFSKEEIAERAHALYTSSIRTQVEKEENIGKMVVIDVQTGDFGVNTTGIETSSRLQANRPNAPLFGIRIGYRVADAMGGVLERAAFCYQ